MTRRWLIRSIFMLPILLCMVGWGWSESHGVAVVYVHRRLHFVECGTGSGRIWLFWVQADALRSPPGELSYRSWRGPVAHPVLPGEMAWLGFRFSHIEVVSYRERTVAVPYWFPLLLSALLLLLAWRTTRPHPGGAQGFPVELATRKEPS